MNKLALASISPGLAAILLRREIVMTFGGLLACALNNHSAPFGAAPNSMAVQPED